MSYGFSCKYCRETLEFPDLRLSRDLRPVPWWASHAGQVEDEAHRRAQRLGWRYTFGNEANVTCPNCAAGASDAISIHVDVSTCGHHYWPTQVVMWKGEPIWERTRGLQFRGQKEINNTHSCSPA
jgi:hypothetical protein